MQKKNCLAYIVCRPTEKGLRAFVSTNQFVIKKMTGAFKEVYIINLNNLKYFNSARKFNSKILKNFKFEKNVKYFFPKNLKEFEIFVKSRKILGLNFFGSSFSNIKILLLLKKNKIDLVQISDVGNVQTGNRALNTEGYLHKFLKKNMHKIIVLLSNLSILPKMEIRFITNTKLIPKNSNKTIYQKIFNKLNLGFAKKIILINSRSFDIFKETTLKKNEKYITVLDEQLNNRQWTTQLGRKPFTKAQLKYHYDKLNEKLKFLSFLLKKKVVICIHPSDDLKLKKNYFKSFKVVQYKTREYIYKSFLVLFFESSAIIDAVLLRKKIMTINSNILDSNQKAAGLHYVKNLGIPILDIDRELTSFRFNKKLVYKKYLYYINKYIVADKSEKRGYEKIIYTLKKKFF